jgi:hypothetical protein
MSDISRNAGPSSTVANAAQQPSFENGVDRRQLLREGAPWICGVLGTGLLGLDVPRALAGSRSTQRRIFTRRPSRDQTVD